MGTNLPDVNLGDDFVVDSVDLGSSHTCALSNHTIKCWGAGSYGRLGTGHTDDLWNPDQQPLDFGINFIPVQLSVGHATSCAVSTNHKCRCWGRGWFGVTGQGNTNDVYMPTVVQFGSSFNVEFVSVGYTSACAVSTIGEMKVCYIYYILGIHHFTHFVFVSVGATTTMVYTLCNTHITASLTLFL